LNERLVQTANVCTSPPHRCNTDDRLMSIG
jgi:hypothetical protein